MMKRSWIVALLVLFASGSFLSYGQAQEGEDAAKRAARPEAAQLLALPPKTVTRHTVKIGGRDYSFVATVGVLAMKDAKGTVQAEISYVSYVLEEAKETEASRNKRPVMIAMNGGPGAASAYLNLLAIGPWRLPPDKACADLELCMKTGSKALLPSSATDLVVNEESLLPFADLVFIDPPGTGYSRILGGEEARKRFFSLEGDIDILSSAISRWMRENNRLASPKFFIGESYGGFRGPLLAAQLQTKQGIGLNGLILVSPVLDFNWVFQSDYAAWAHAGLLPSFAAGNLELQGKPFDTAMRKAVEEYASGPYLTDLMKGLRDAEAVARVSEKVADLTGLDPALVKRMAGRIDIVTFQRERMRDRQQVLSLYDTGVSGHDPNPTSARSRFEDPGLSGMIAPLSSAMVDFLRNKLDYKADDFQYQLLNNEVNRAWDWGKDRSNAAESLSALKQAMALDPTLNVLVVHGVTDLVTPYFTNQLLLNQMPALGDTERLRLEVFPGGHMFYSRDTSRAAMRDSVKAFFTRTLERKP